MKRRLDKRGVGKLSAVIGIGGVSCPCCVWRTKAYAKLLWNRISRKHERAMLRMELKEVLNGQ